MLTTNICLDNLFSVILANPFGKIKPTSPSIPARILSTKEKLQPLQDQGLKPTKPIRFETEKDHVKEHDKYFINESEYIKKILSLYNQHLNKANTPSQPIWTDKAPFPLHAIKELSQNPNHVLPISNNNLFYEETDKLKKKPRLVDGNHYNYRPRPWGPWKPFVN